MAVHKCWIFIAALARVVAPPVDLAFCPVWTVIQLVSARERAHAAQVRAVSHHRAGVDRALVGAPDEALQAVAIRAVRVLQRLIRGPFQGLGLHIAQLATVGTLVEHVCCVARALPGGGPLRAVIVTVEAHLRANVARFRTRHVQVLVFLALALARPSRAGWVLIVAKRLANATGCAAMLVHVIDVFLALAIVRPRCALLLLIAASVRAD